MFDTTDSPDSPPLQAHIRRATVHDAPEIARVNLDTWRVAYRGLLPTAYLDKLSLAKGEQAQREHLAMPDQARFLAVSPQKALGFSAVGRNRVPVEGFDGELYGLYVRPAFQRLGLGSRLFGASVQWLKDEGYRSMIVWVLKDNPARVFYEEAGGRPLPTTRMRMFSGTRMMEVSYGWDDLSRLTGIAAGNQPIEGE